MTGLGKWTALKHCALAALIPLACLAGPRYSESRAEEPALLPELKKSEAADGALPGEPLLKTAEANTPARLNAEATSGSQPISSRPLMCCRPAHPAAQGAQARQVHPTLAALAEAVRSRRGAGHAPTQESARQPVAPLATVTETETAVEPSAPASEFSEPEPFRDEAFEVPSPIAAPAERQAEPDEQSEPLTIANPWTARLAPVATKEHASPPASEPIPQPVREPVAEPTSQQRHWRSAEPRPVRLARYHHAERNTASIDLAPFDYASPAAPTATADHPTDKNPLRSAGVAPIVRGGIWSSASENPLR